MTMEQFRQIYDDWKESGLSVQQYCENTGLTESRFYYWRAKIQAESLPSSCGSFIPVKMSGKTSVSSAKNASGKALCEIEYPNGVVVRVTTDMHKSYAGPTALTELTIGKFADHLPFYRQIAMFKRLGIELKQPTIEVRHRRPDAPHVLQASGIHAAA